MVRPAAVKQERETGRARSRRCRAAGVPQRVRGASAGTSGVRRGGRGWGRRRSRGVARAGGRADERSSARTEGAAGPPEAASALGRSARAAGGGEEDEAPRVPPAPTPWPWLR